MTSLALAVTIQQAIQQRNVNTYEHFLELIHAVISSQPWK